MATRNKTGWQSKSGWDANTKKEYNKFYYALKNTDLYKVGQEIKDANEKNWNQYTKRKSRNFNQMSKRQNRNFDKMSRKQDAAFNKYDGDQWWNESEKINNNYDKVNDKNNRIYNNKKDRINKTYEKRRQSIMREGIKKAIPAMFKAPGQILNSKPMRDTYEKMKSETLKMPGRMISNFFKNASNNIKSTINRGASAVQNIFKKKRNTTPTKKTASNSNNYVFTLDKKTGQTVRVS